MNLYKKRVYNRVTIPFTSNHCWLKFHIPIMISLYHQIKKRGYVSIFELLLREWGKKALNYNTQFYAAINIL